jgi:hypothetical protein
MRARFVFPAVVAGALALSAALLAPRIRATHDAESAPGSEPAEASPPETTPAAEPSVSASASAPSPPVTAAPTASPAEPPPSYVHVDPASASACPKAMLLVDGVHCPYVGHRCLEFLNEEKDVCRSYAPEVLCEGRLERLRFCMDTYEYPNLEGATPVVMVDFDDATRACEVEGKRLCTTGEWEFACEGPAMWPYPYGLERDATACNVDRPYPLPELEAFSDPWKISGEVARLDQRVPSGSMTRCVSPFGVHDMTGNVDEWVEYPEGKIDDKPYRSALKGGYWGPVRARCRPKTTSHNQWFSFYQVGFRCCSDPIDHAPKSTAPLPRIPKRGRIDPPR